MRVMILAAGLGTRLRPLTTYIPKPLVPVLGKPLLEHAVDLLQRHGLGEAVINLHYLPEAVKSYFRGVGTHGSVALSYSYEPELLGTAGGVKRNEAFLTAEGAFLVISGDALTDADLCSLISAHKESGAIATLAVKEVEDPSRYGVVETDEGGRIVMFQEKPAPGQEISRLANCGIYVLEPEVLRSVPSSTFYDFGRQLWPTLLAAGEHLHAHRISEYWNDIGDLASYRQGNVDALQGRVVLSHSAVEEQPGVWLGQHVRLGDHVELIPPVFLADGCHVESGARLVGPSVLGAHCTVEAGASVVESILWDAVFVGRGAKLQRCICGASSRFQGWTDALDCVFGDRCLVSDVGVLRDLSLEAGTVLWG